jgi:site-specific DNA-cytosine methylase
MDFESETFVVHGSQDPCVSRDAAFALGRNQGQENALCISSLRAPEKDNPPLAVRRLTPIECERLQGFPDNWTLIPGRRRNFQHSEADKLEYLSAHARISDPELLVRLAADGPRYKAIGNSMAIPVMRWIGERLCKAVTRDAGPA